MYQRNRYQNKKLYLKNLDSNLNMYKMTKMTRKSLNFKEC